MTPAGADGEIKVSMTVAETGLLTNKKNIKFVENKKACKQPETLSFFFSGSTQGQNFENSHKFAGIKIVAGIIFDK